MALCFMVSVLTASCHGWHFLVLACTLPTSQSPITHAVCALRYNHLLQTKLAYLAAARASSRSLCSETALGRNKGWRETRGQGDSAHHSRKPGFSCRKSGYTALRQDRMSRS